MQKMEMKEVKIFSGTSNVITGAGSVITKDVAPRALAVERNKQIIKFEWRK